MSYSYCSSLQKINVALGASIWYLHDMAIEKAVSKLGVLAKELTGANSVRERVRISHEMFDTLGEVEREIESFVMQEIAHVNGNGSGPKALPAAEVYSSTRFAKSSIAEGTRILLQENHQLHGHEIEKRLRLGGYPTKATKFQPILRNTLNRVGGFENIGGNIWRLKDSGGKVEPE